MEKQEFIQRELTRLLRDWFIKASLMGAGIFLLFSPLDFVSVPERFAAFLVYRIVIAAVLVALALVARKVHGKKAIEVLAVLAVLFSAVAIEVMILQFGGHQSPYYAGMILLSVVALGFLPVGIRFHVLLAATIYLVYFVPIVMTQEIHDFRTFFTQSYLLLFILGAVVVIRHFNLSALIGKIGLNYEITRHQEDLEDLIEDRTGSLTGALDEWHVTFDSTEDMMLLVDENGDIVKANKATAAFAMSDVRELSGGSVFDLCSAEVLPPDRHPFTRMKASGEREHGEFYSARRKQWFSVSAEPLRAGHLREKGAVLIIRDITGIKTLERGLVEAKEEWEETFNIIEDGISIHDDDHNIIRANEATRRLLGIGDGPLEGRKCYEFFHGSDEPITGCPACEARRSGKTTVVDLFEPKIGKYLEVTALPRPGKDGAGDGIIHVVRDITERKEAIDEIDQAYRRMERILEMAPFGVFIVNTDNRIEYANPAIHALSGMPQGQFAGSHVGDLQGCRDIGLSDRIVEAFQGQPFSLGPVEFQCHREEGKSVGRFTGIPVEESGKRKVLVFIDDLTELKGAEEERARLQTMLMETQKMESIGTLAGGIAHDFNNILTAIMNYAGICLMKLPEDEPVRKYISTILDSGERAAGLTRQLLAFSRRKPLQVKAVDLNNTIEDTVRMLRRIISEDIDLKLNLHRPLRKIRANRGKIEQVILNLAVNAGDAMPLGGTLTIETAPAEGTESAGGEKGPASPWPHVLLVVRDTGEGMSPEVRQRIFEPFFTTKGPGKGTGLGLATVYGIVRQHKGHIEVKSEVGKGSEFSVLLPASSGEEEEEGAAASGGSPRGSETILVVDDEEHILESLREVLSSLGYSVLTAPSGEEALELIEGRQGSIDLLLADIIMKGVDGQQLAGKLSERFPDIKVLLMSGHTPDKMKEKGLLNLSAPILDKPLKIEDLSRKIREALGGGCAVD